MKKKIYSESRKDFADPCYWRKLQNYTLPTESLLQNL